MKRILYILMAFSLAVSLVGCGDSGGGYWMANPAAAPAPAGSGNSQSLGGAVAAKTVAANTLTSTAGCMNAVSAGIGANPVLADFGLSMPSFSSGMGIIPPASIKTASRSRQRTDAATNNMALTTGTGSYTKFGYTTSGTSYMGMTYAMTYEMYMMFLKSDGTVLTPSTTGTYFYSFSNGTYSDVDVIKYYGTWTCTVSYETTSSSSSTTSCAVLADSCSSSSSSSTNAQPTVAAAYKMTGTYGSESDPCFVGGLTNTILYSGHTYMKSNGTWKVEGTFDGDAYNQTISNVVSGSETYQSVTGLFKSAPLSSTSSTTNYGYGSFKTTSSDGNSAEMKANGTTLQIYLNGELVTTY